MNDTFPRKYRQSLGKSGETQAVSYLEHKGYHILDRNFKARYGEIDIIALDEDTLVFVEVKTRTTDGFGMPEESVTPWKLTEVLKTAEYYLFLHEDLPESYRVDVIGIKLDGSGKILAFNHLQNVTG